MSNFIYDAPHFGQNFLCTRIHVHILSICQIVINHTFTECARPSCSGCSKGCICPKIHTDKHSLRLHHDEWSLRQNRSSWSALRAHWWRVFSGWDWSLTIVVDIAVVWLTNGYMVKLCTAIKKLLTSRLKFSMLCPTSSSYYPLYVLKCFPMTSCSKSQTHFTCPCVIWFPWASIHAMLSC